MAIPRKYKKQVRNDIKSAKRLGNAPKTKRTWSFKKGDLVRFGDVIGVIAKDRGSGYYLVISPEGNKSIHAKNLERVQRLDAE